MANNYTYNSNSSDKSFDVREFIHNCRRRWWWFLITGILISGIAAYKYLSYVTTFDVNASIIIYGDTKEGGSISLARQFSMSSVLGGSGDVNNERDVLRSHTVMLATVKDLELNVGYTEKKGLREIPCYLGSTPLELTCDPAIADTLGIGLEFKVKCDKNEIAHIIVKAKDKKIQEINDAKFPVTIDTPYGVFTISQTDAYVKGKSLNEDITILNYDTAAEIWSNRVGVVIPDRKSDLISLSVNINDPKFGERLIDTIIQKYNERGITEKQNRDRRTAQFIEERLSSLTNELALSEGDIEQFQKDKNLIDLGSEAKLILSRLTELESTIEESTTTLSLLEQTRDFLQNSDNKYQLIPLGLSSGPASELIRSYNELIMYRMSLSNGAKSDNVVLKNLDEKIDATRANMLKSLAKTIETQRFKHNELLAKNREYEAKLNQFPAEQRLYRGIERQQSVKEQLYLFLLQQREETVLRIANAQPRAVIVDNAFTLNTPHVVSLKLLAIMILFFTFGIPMGIIFVREKLRNKIESRKDVDKLSNIPILAEISEAKDTPLVMQDGAMTIVAEQFRLARANIQFVLASKKEKVVVVTSTNPGEGKTFVAINLAAALSIPNSKVLLIGADIRRPKLFKYLNIHSQFGLTEYLSSDDVSVDQLINKTPVEGTNMDVITAGPLPPNPSELLLSPKFDSLVQELRNRYDYIVIDSAPMGLVSDTINIERIADATVYVCRFKKTRLDDFTVINELAADERMKKMTLVVNGARTRRDMSYNYAPQEDK